MTLGQSGSANTATLTPTFADDATAKVGGAGPGAGGDTTLGLTDPDSNAEVPFFASSFGGDYVLDSQADQQLIFVNGIDTAGSFGPGNLTQLPLTHDDPAHPGNTIGAGVDDIRWTGGGGGSLIIVDGQSNTVYDITGPFPDFQAFAALDTVGANADTTEVDSLDPATGKLTTFATGFGAAKGLLWVATPGTPGATGPQGPPGATGPQGPVGPPPSTRAGSGSEPGSGHEKHKPKKHKPKKHKHARRSAARKHHRHHQRHGRRARH